VCARELASFSFRFSNEERAKIEVDVSGALRGIKAMRDVQQSLGKMFSKSKIIRNDQYEKTRDALRQIREQVIDIYARNEKEKKIWRESWSFDN